MTSYLAIDPGPTKSAYVIWGNNRVQISGIVPNEDLLYGIQNRFPMCRADICVIEEIASYGMPVGREVFNTCVWTGRYFQAWLDTHKQEPLLIQRATVKLHHCLSKKANDSNVRAALIDRIGKPGTKKAPGPTYGVKNDEWQALALCVYAMDTENARRQGAVA